MLDEQTPAEPGNEPTTSSSTPADTPDVVDTPEATAPAPRKRAPRKTAAKKAAAAEAETPAEGTGTSEAPPPARRTRKSAAKKTAAAPADADAGSAPATEQPDQLDGPAGEEAAPPPAKKAPARRSAKKSASTTTPDTDGTPAADQDTAATDAPDQPTPVAVPLFQPPDPAAAKPAKKTSKKKSSSKASASTSGDEPDEAAETAAQVTGADVTAEDTDGDTARPVESDDESTDENGTDETGDDSSDESEGGARRRRRRGGRRRRKGSGEGSDGSDGQSDGGQSDSGDNDAKPDARQDDGQGPGDKGQSDSDGEGSSSTRRRRRRRRAGDGDDESSDDSENTVTRVRKPRSAEDEITGFSGSTRLEAKKQRRREGREAGRRRAPIISEAEFLARREAVDRKMVIRQRNDLTQIAVLEDKVLVEHYVARESQTSLIGNVYLGRVQNVLPSMEAAFIDIGKGRNAVLYAGEVNWDSFGAKDGNQRKIEQVLKPGQPVLVQVSKDPIGHKGARLTSQISLPGRFLVYVPDGNTSGISRKLPENERNRLKTLLKEIVPDSAGVIVRTAAEGASEDELTRDVERLKALWEDVSSKVEGGNAPQLLYGEPDLTLKVVRDLFTEDIAKLVVSGDEAWDMVENYVKHVAPDLEDRLEKHDDSERDAFAEYRIDEQINKAMDRKVWLPSGGSLVIDRTEAMTVVDVNTGKFTGSGGNLEETVTKNNLEAAEEIVRQLRLRDIGGIIVIDFIDMVLENNRDLVLRRLIECLGRDRTRHQVAEVTSLGLVQMTRKRIGTGLLEAFSEPCEHCQGRGLHVHQEPVDQKRKAVDEEPRRNRRNRGRGKGGDEQESSSSGTAAKAPADVRRPSPAEFAAMARIEPTEDRSPAEDAAVAAEAEAEPQSDAAAQTPAQPQAEAPAELPAAPELEQQQAPEQTSDPEPEQKSEPEAPTPPPPPAAPRIVTSVRRVGARRAAGPPAVQTSATASAGPAAGSALDGAGEAHVNGDARGAVVVAPSGSDTEEAVEVAEPSVDGLDGVDGVGQPHVPVKKKGARKR